jgi:hypothetical protein
MDFLEAIANSDDEEHEEYLEWVGGAFDREQFDVDDFEDAIDALVNRE